MLEGLGRLELGVLRSWADLNMGGHLNSPVSSRLSFLSTLLLLLARKNQASRICWSGFLSAKCGRLMLSGQQAWFSKHGGLMSFSTVADFYCNLFWDLIGVPIMRGSPMWGSTLGVPYYRKPSLGFPKGRSAL